MNQTIPIVNLTVYRHEMDELYRSNNKAGQRVLYESMNAATHDPNFQFLSYYNVRQNFLKVLGQVLASNRNDLFRLPFFKLAYSASSSASNSIFLFADVRQIMQPYILQIDPVDAYASRLKYWSGVFFKITPLPPPTLLNESRDLGITSFDNTLDVEKQVYQNGILPIVQSRMSDNFVQLILQTDLPLNFAQTLNSSKMQNYSAFVARMHQVEEQHRSANHLSSTAQIRYQVTITEYCQNDLKSALGFYVHHNVKTRSRMFQLWKAIARRKSDALVARDVFYRKKPDWQQLFDDPQLNQSVLPQATRDEEKGFQETEARYQTLQPDELVPIDGLLAFQLAIQLIHGFTTLQSARIYHNDTHMTNFRLIGLPIPMTLRFDFTSSSGQSPRAVWMRTEWMPKMFDWDRATMYSMQVDRAIPTDSLFCPLNLQCANGRLYDDYMGLFTDFGFYLEICFGSGSGSSDQAGKILLDWFHENILSESDMMRAIKNRTHLHRIVDDGIAPRNKSLFSVRDALYDKIAQVTDTRFRLNVQQVQASQLPYTIAYAFNPQWFVIPQQSLIGEFPLQMPQSLQRRLERVDREPTRDMIYRDTVRNLPRTNNGALVPDTDFLFNLAERFLSVADAASRNGVAQTLRVWMNELGHVEADRPNFYAQYTEKIWRHNFKLICLHYWQLNDRYVMDPYFALAVWFITFPIAYGFPEPLLEYFLSLNMKEELIQFVVQHSGLGRIEWYNMLTFVQHNVKNEFLTATLQQPSLFLQSSNELSRTAIYLHDLQQLPFVKSIHLPIYNYHRHSHQ